jgi:hypothetical protein
MTTKTRYKDKHGQKICVGDVIHVEEYPDKYVGGSYDFEGIVEQDNDGKIVVSYYDYSSYPEEMVPLSRFPVNGREILRRLKYAT